MGARAVEVRLSEVIGALSFALDLADGHALGHSVRSCAIGMRLADQIGVDDERSSALYYGLLLKDAGCSANASQFAALYRADDRAVKRKAIAVDYTRPAEALRYIWGAVGGQGLGRVANAVRASTVGVRKVRELTVVRCDRGAEIARMIDLPEEAAAAIRALDEHWDGGGHPLGLTGDEIPVLGRILALAQAVEVFCSLGGRESAYAMASERSGRWYDRELADVAGAHHERLDGSGYHRGRTAESLTVPARILAVADVYEALTAERPYRHALTPEEALAIVAGDAGTALCETSVAALERTIDRLPLAA